MNQLSRCSHFLLSLTVLFCASVSAQPGAVPPLGDGPWVFDTYQEDNVRVSVVTRNLANAFGMVILPNTATATNTLGDVIISERYGKIKFLPNGESETITVVDLMDVFPMEQLFDLKLHPQFEQNGLIYFTYIREEPHPNGTDDYWIATAVGRGHWNGSDFVDIEDVFIAQSWSSNVGGASSRMQFLPDNTFLLGVSHRIDREAPQSLMSHIGKVLRLNDDGSVPADNPYVGVANALPEIYTLGNRSVMDFTIHPTTGEVWELENGPQGGDEVNILKPTLNYGWPIATYGRDYDGTLFNPAPWTEGTELPEIYWVPSITVGGLSFYTGDKFPNWKGNLFVTSMVQGRIFGTGHLERIVINEFGETMREQLLNDLHQRIRYVEPGEDGLIYMLTDATDGALLRMEPGASTQQISQNRDPNAMFPDEDCSLCHRTEDKLVGPSFTDIAQRYSLNEANISLLADRIIQGGGGAWGETPMAPHADINRNTARAMAEEILGL